MSLARLQHRLDHHLLLNSTAANILLDAKGSLSDAEKVQKLKWLFAATPVDLITGVEIPDDEVRRRLENYAEANTRTEVPFNLKPRAAPAAPAVPTVLHKASPSVGTGAITFDSVAVDVSTLFARGATVSQLRSRYSLTSNNIYNRYRSLVLRHSGRSWRTDEIPMRIKPEEIWCYVCPLPELSSAIARLILSEHGAEQTTLDTKVG